MSSGGEARGRHARFVALLALVLVVTAGLLVVLNRSDPSLDGIEIAIGDSCGETFRHSGSLILTPFEAEAEDD